MATDAFPVQCMQAQVPAQRTQAQVPAQGGPAVDAAAKKHALRLVPYGLYLAGSRRKDGRMNVSLVSWFTQTSFDPPLVVLGMHKESEAYAAATETGVLALNLLGSTQKETVKSFYKHVEVKEGKAGPLDVKEGATSKCPLLPALAAALELKLKATHVEGEHASCIFEVTDAHVFDKDASALDHKTAGLHYAG